MRRAPTAAVILFVALAAALNQKHGLSIPAG